MLQQEPSSQRACRRGIRQSHNRTFSSSRAMPCSSRGQRGGGGVIYCCLKSLWILILLGFSCCHLATASALWTLTIGPYEESCFLVRYSGSSSNVKTTMSSSGSNAETTTATTSTPSNKMLSGNYELLDQRLSAEPVVVYVMENDKVVWHSKENTPYDRFHVPLETNKRYWICLQNSSHGPLAEGEEGEHPDDEARVLGFSYRVHSKTRLAPAAAAAEAQPDFDEEKFNSWVEKAEDLADDLSDFKDHFEYIKRREADHRSLVEATFDACLTWTIVEVGIVVTMAVGQVIFYRRFLEKKQQSYNYY